MKLVITFQIDENGTHVAKCPAILGCDSQGATEEEAIENIHEAIEGCLSARAANGPPLSGRCPECGLATPAFAAPPIPSASTMSAD